ncbi:MAG: GNAT family N-acetyltransferase [Cereibacter sp.]
MSQTLPQPEIRDLNGMAEFRQAETLQNDVWGKEDTADPADLMMVIQAEGGLCAGAFLEGRLIGYVFGFPSKDSGVQHSHRLAVHPDARGLHLGSRLKWYQRDWCLARGIDLVRWTFDPLRGLNASLNLGTLRAIVRTYYTDYYGDMKGINAGPPSDRLLAEWRLRSDAVSAQASGLPAKAHGMVSQRLKLAEGSDDLISNDPSRALAERMRLRQAITGAMAEGQAIIGFDRSAREYLIGRLET